MTLDSVSAMAASAAPAVAPVPALAPAPAPEPSPDDDSFQWTTGKIFLSLALFLAAGLAEIGGGWLVWQTLREHKGWWMAVLGAGVLFLYGVLPTFQPLDNFGRVRQSVLENTPQPICQLLPASTFLVLCCTCCGLDIKFDWMKVGALVQVQIYAVYGGFFILLSYLWGWAVDKDRPDVGEAESCFLCLRPHSRHASSRHNLHSRRSAAPCASSLQCSHEITIKSRAGLSACFKRGGA
jgi:small multidrug resistance family-3 protein